MPTEFLVADKTERFLEARRLSEELMPENARGVYERAERYCEKCNEWKLNPAITCTRCYIWKVKKNALQFFKK
jgi:uncharacterized paraquat-inducible protein A